MINTVLILLIGPLLLQPLQAKGKQRNSQRESGSAAEHSAPPRAVKDLRVPADRALERKIKSICRGC